MKQINGADPTQDPTYQAFAAAVDRGVTTVLLAAEQHGGVPPGAVIAGTVYALVRYTLETMQAVPTVRNVLGVLVPSVNRAAEDVAVKGVVRRVAAPSEPGPGV